MVASQTAIIPTSTHSEMIVQTNSQGDDSTSILPLHQQV